MYSSTMSAENAGESIVWSLACQDTVLRKGLRLPAEDGNYEKPLMDARGL